MTINRPKLMDDLTDRLVEALQSKTQSAIYSATVRTRECLIDYSDEALQRMDAYLSDPRNRPNSLAYLVWEEPAETLINECLSFFPHLPVNYRSRVHVESLHRYPQLPKVEDYSTLDDEWKERIIALLSVTYTLAESTARNVATATIKVPKGDYATFINDSDLTKLILANPLDAEKIASIIIERHTNDASQIAVVLDFNVTPLRNGVL